MYVLRCFIYDILLSFICSAAYSIKQKESKSRLLIIIVSIIFSQFITIGKSIYLDHSLNLCFSNVISLIYWIYSTILWTIIIYPILVWIVYWINHISIKSDPTKINYTKLSITTVGPRLLCFLLFYPCLFDFDAGLGLRIMIQPGEVISNHHPYFIQLLHSAFYRIGNTIGDPAIGMSILTLLYIVFISAIIIYSTKTIELLNVGKRIF